MKTIFWAFLFCSIGSVHAEPKPNPELITAGKTSFGNNCVVCHGEKALGDGIAASTLNPKPRNLVKDQFKNGMSKEKIYETLSKGLKGSAMPGFPQLGDSERWSLVYYILSLRKT